MPHKFIYEIFVHYGDGEYSQHISCEAVAQQAVQSFHRHLPIIVNVYEHAGWWMAYFFDQDHPRGICVGTANDAAQFSPEQKKILEEIFRVKRHPLPSIYRQPLAGI